MQKTDRRVRYEIIDPIVAMLGWGEVQKPQGQHTH